MRIVVNDIAASTTGALSILKEFYSYVRENGSKHEWIFLLSDNYVEETENIKVICKSDVKKNWFRRLKFDLISGHKYIESLKPDVYFSLQNTMSFFYKGRQIIYVHQPLGFQKEKNFSLFKAEEREYAIYQHIIGRLIDISIKKSDHTIVQTRWMKDAIVKKLRVSEEKVSNILPSLENYSEYEINECPDRKCFFYPSGDIIYKNHESIYSAVKELIKSGITDFKIYLTLNEKEFSDLVKPKQGDVKQGDGASASKQGDGASASNKGSSQSAGACEHDIIMSHFVCMGRIDRSKVFEYYQRSALLFPSYIETFGYPLAEARGVGTIILASDCPFSRELLEGYENAHFFHPFDVNALSSLMKAYISGDMDYHAVHNKDEENKEKKLSIEEKSSLKENKFSKEVSSLKNKTSSKEGSSLKNKTSSKENSSSENNASVKENSHSENKISSWKQVVEIIESY